LSTGSEFVAKKKKRKKEMNGRMVNSTFERDSLEIGDLFLEYFFKAIIHVDIPRNMSVPLSIIKIS